MTVNQFVAIFSEQRLSQFGKAESVIFRQLLNPWKRLEFLDTLSHGFRAFSFLFKDGKQREIIGVFSIVLKVTQEEFLVSSDGIVRIVFQHGL